MREQLITFETAKLAKDKGFNIEVFSSYVKGDIKPNVLNNGYDFNTDKVFDGRISAPTQSLLQKWLRDEYLIFVHVEFCNDPLKGFFEYTIMSLLTEDYEDDITYDTYEEALEAGLQEALKLIK